MNLSRLYSYDTGFFQDTQRANEATIQAYNSFRQGWIGEAFKQLADIFQKAPLSRANLFSNLIMISLSTYSLDELLLRVPDHLKDSVKAGAVALYFMKEQPDRAEKIQSQITGFNEKLAAEICNCLFLIHTKKLTKAFTMASAFPATPEGDSARLAAALSFAGTQSFTNAKTLLDAVPDEHVEKELILSQLPQAYFDAFPSLDYRDALSL